MMQTKTDAEQLEKMAKENDGRCSHCGQPIKIYHYKINKTHANFMKTIAESVKNSGKNDVDIGTLGMAYSARSQITKLRLHGLVARVKDERGVQIHRHWLITKKGYSFLAGNPVPAKVSGYNNQVLGHAGGDVTINEVLGYEDVEAEAITEPEAKVLEDVRTPQKYTIHRAEFKTSDYVGKLKRGRFYDIQIKRLEVGNPVVVVGIDSQPRKIIYHDIAAFQKDWRITA